MKSLMAFSLSVILVSCATSTKQTNLNTPKRGLAQDAPLNTFTARVQMFWAATRGKVKVLEEMHNKGHNLNTKDPFGNTPAHEAARYSEIKVLEYLNSEGYRLDIPNNYGDTPLDIAKNYKQRKAIKFLEKINKNTSGCY